MLFDSYWDGIIFFSGDFCLIFLFKVIFLWVLIFLKWLFMFFIILVCVYVLCGKDLFFGEYDVDCGCV